MGDSEFVDDGSNGEGKLADESNPGGDQREQGDELGSTEVKVAKPWWEERSEQNLQAIRDNDRAHRLGNLKLPSINMTIR